MGNSMSNADCEDSHSIITPGFGGRGDIGFISGITISEDQANLWDMSDTVYVYVQKRLVNSFFFVNLIQT